LAAIARALPRADLVYLADTAHLPYGDKDDAYIRRPGAAIGSHLVDHGCRVIVVACNTATAAAVAAFRETFPGSRWSASSPASSRLRRSRAVAASPSWRPPRRRAASGWPS
jgi:glutamate racemase